MGCATTLAIILMKTKVIISVLMLFWTLAIALKLSVDLINSETNYFGTFFAISIGLFMILIGDGLLIVLYFLIKHFVGD